MFFKSKHLNSINAGHHKNTAGCATEVIPVPASVRISMSQNIGAPCQPLVKKGDTVLVGQKIGDTDAFLHVPVHSSVSGKVTGIETLRNAMDGMEKEVAFVMCNGTTNNAKKLYEYADIKTCKAAKQLFGGSKACPNGCLGLGDCEAACEFNAIHVIKGAAVVDRSKCTSCSACIKACPNNLIKLVPENKAKVIVRCHNTQKGAEARKNCTTACIGCGMCARSCKFVAITIENNLSVIDHEKCKKCGMCVVKCSTGAIQDMLHTTEQLEKIKKSVAAMEAKEAEKRNRLLLKQRLPRRQLPKKPPQRKRDFFTIDSFFVL